MPTPFDSFGYTDGQQTVAQANTRAALTGLAVTPLYGQGVADSSPRRVDIATSVALIRAMLAGDMWLGGVGWIGPRPAQHEDGFHETMSILQMGFVSQNALADVVDRHVAGVIGDEPRWGLTVRRQLKQDEKPNEAEETAINEAEAFVTEWWDFRKLHSIFADAVRTLLFARRGVVRLFVPRGKLQRANVVGDDGRTRTVKVVPIANGDIAGALRVIWPDVPQPEHSTVAEDPDSKEHVGIVIYALGQNVQGTGSTTNVAELSYLSDRAGADGKPLTIIRLARTDRNNANAPTADNAVAMLTLGGRIPMFEMQRAPFITTQMIQIQRALNLALTALPRNVITSGWLERAIANAQMPGKWVTDATAASGKRWVRDVHTTGAGVTTYLKGLKQEDASTGAISYTTPQISWREPSPVQPTVDAFESLYRALLREAKQEHVLMSQDIKASGKSREQARKDFEMTLRPTAVEVNALGRWLIETVLAMAEQFAGTPGKYTGQLRATFECAINTGPINDVERVAIDGSVKAGTLSTVSAMELQGVTDTARELARIASQPGADLAIAERQLTAVGAAANAGLDIEGSALAVGMDADEAAGLVPQFTDVGNVDANGDPIPPVDPLADPANPGNPPPKKPPVPARRRPPANAGSGAGAS